MRIETMDCFKSKIERMVRPSAMKSKKYQEFGNGTGVDIWNTLCAALAGDLKKIKRLEKKNPALLECNFNYTPPIYFAVREGHQHVVRYLLERGVDPTFRTYPYHDSLLTIARDRGDNAMVQLVLGAILQRLPNFSEDVGPLLEATEDGDRSKIASFLNSTPHLVSACDFRGVTALHKAVTRGELSLIRYLLDHGADIGACDSEGHKPLDYALSGVTRIRPGNNPTAIAGYLLGRGADYNIQIASWFGDVEQVREFLASDPDLAKFRDTNQVHPLSQAARHGHVEIVRLLLEYGADPNAPEIGAPRGHALWLAVFFKHPEVVRLLLEHGADPNANVESSGFPIIHCKEGDEIHTLLLRHGARAGVGTAARETSVEPKIEDRLCEAISRGDVPTIDGILEARPKLAKRNDFFWDEGIMTMAAKSGDIPMLKCLLRHGAQVPPVTKWGQTYYFRHYDVAKLLLENGMDPNHKNWLGMTLTHQMAAANEMDKLKLLLKHGADIEVIDEELCSTPLGWAARWGNFDIAKFLLKKGADPNGGNEPWAKPLSWAEKRGHEKIARLLRKHGASAGE